MVYTLLICKHNICVGLQDINWMQFSRDLCDQVCENQSVGLRS